MSSYSEGRGKKGSQRYKGVRLGPLRYKQPGSTRCFKDIKQEFFIIEIEEIMKKSRTLRSSCLARTTFIVKNCLIDIMKSTYFFHRN